MTIFQTIIGIVILLFFVFGGWQSIRLSQKCYQIMRDFPVTTLSTKIMRWYFFISALGTGIVFLGVGVFSIVYQVGYQVGLFPAIP